MQLIILMHSVIVLIITEETHYSSDSGVDANSVSSCESVPQPEGPQKMQFNHEDVVNFLMKS